MPRLSDQTINELIVTLYQGVIHGGHWEYWLEQLLEGSGSNAGWVTLVDRQSLRADSLADVGFEGIPDYNAYFHEKDILAEALMESESLEEGHFYCSQEAVDYGAYLNSEIYNDFNRHHGIAHVCGGYASLPGSDKVFRLSFFRDKDQALFTPEHVRRLDLLMPHLTQSLQMDELSRYHRLPSRSPFRHLDEIGVGALVCDRQGRVHYLNGEAETLLLESGLARVSSGQLLLKGEQGQKRLLEALNQACGILDIRSIPQVAPIRIGEESQGVELLARPWCAASHSFEDASLNALVLLRNPERFRHLNLSLLQRQMGLSGREVEVAQLVARGLDARSIAHECFVAETTVRTHIQALLRKFGVRSQQQLIARLHDPLLTLA
ncbi:helix-turn-helix transcriptional regulator [Ferrimonas futtsuensis]|uniref:helix-turn-helix transcriptional regulator n=1 Tax=Ferrimonas futtsuensis TaxID=364764 RepID=UPI00040456B9|nr:helix-turn-helix transcriptional regulator [Ferrimonas futtsuensis]